MIKTTLTDNLKYYRKQKGYNQKVMAANLEVKHSRLGAWEEGRAKPNPDFLQKIAEIFDITVDQLLKQREDTSVKEKK
jgi:transcriptional regulator with XRE-family HTH domain